MTGQQPLHVILLMRRSLPGQFSIERVFADVAAHLGPGFQVEVVQVPHVSRRILPRLRNIWFTSRLRAGVIHVTGDIHYCAMGIRRRRCVLTVHDVVSLERLKHWRRALLLCLWYRLPCWWATRVTTISPFTSEQLIAAVPRIASKTLVIPDPVSDRFTVSSESLPVRRPKRVLQVGTKANKNLSRVVAGLHQLDVELRVIGPLNDEQRKLLNNSGLEYSDVSNLSDDQLTSEYCRADILAFVSTYEGFGLPIVEAQSVGLPVVTSICEPMAWVAGDGALLVDPYESEEIGGAVRSLLEDAPLRHQVRQAGFTNVRRFAADAIAAKYADVYREVSRS